MNAELTSSLYFAASNELKIIAKRIIGSTDNKFMKLENGNFILKVP